MPFSGTFRRNKEAIAENIAACRESERMHAIVKAVGNVDERHKVRSEVKMIKRVRALSDQYEKSIVKTKTGETWDE